jgi:hypothetical protein
MAVAIDFAGLHSVVASEIQRALEDARTGGIEVTSVRIRMTQPDPTGGDDDGLILDDRALQAGQPWDLVLDLAPGRSTTPRFTSFGEAPKPIVRRESALAYFGPRPVSVLKGISSGWSRRLAGFGIRRIVELARLQPEALEKIYAKARSVRVLEFQAKARLLEAEIPIFDPSRADRSRLGQLVGDSPETLRAHIGSAAIGTSESIALADLLATLTICIDDVLLDRTTLGELRKAGAA